MGCGSTKTITVAVTEKKKEWEPVRNRFIVGKTQYDVKKREEVWKLFDREMNGSATYAECERGMIHELGLGKILTRKQLTPILVRAFNSAKSHREDMSPSNPLSPLASQNRSPLGAGETASSPKTPLSNANAANPNVAVVTEKKEDEIKGDLSISSHASPIIDFIEIPNLHDAPTMPTRVTTSNAPNSKQASPSASDNRAGGANSSLTQHSQEPPKRINVPTTHKEMKQREKASNLQRGEFRLFLMYVADFMDLYLVFETVDHGGDSKISFDEFQRAVPILKQWGIPVDDPEAIFKTIDASTDGRLTFKEFSEWAIRQHIDRWNK